MLRTAALCTLAAAALSLTACNTTTPTADATPSSSSSSSAAAEEVSVPAADSAAQPVAASATMSPYSKPGFTVEEVDGVLWVLEPGQERSGDAVTLVGAGPAGKSVRALDRETAVEYLAAKPGFITMVEDGRVWVLERGEKPEGDHVTLVGKGPRGMTIKANHKETAYRYLYAKPGFNVQLEDGRLWVLRPGEKQEGDHVTLIHAYDGLTVKALDRETALEYIAAKPGFETRIRDGRLWVLRPGEEPSAEMVTRVGAGPMGMTVRANDRETLDAYFRS